MSVTLTVSDKTFQKLQISARQQGKKNVEQLLEEWPFQDTDISSEELLRRKEVGKRIRQLQKRLSEKYGTMPDSTPLIREDRER